MRLAAWLLALAAGTAGAEPAVVVGAAVPETGLYAGLAAEYRNALVLWQDEVNAAGGLLGRRVELRLVDDRSESRVVQSIYRRLIDEGAQILVGPFGSAPALGAAAVAERSQRVLVNATGAAAAAQRAGTRYVFQVALPYAEYGAGVLALMREADARSVIVLARGDPATREPAERLRDDARKLGISCSEVQIYGSGTTDFSAWVERAKKSGAQAWVAFGPAREAAEMVKTFRRLGYAPRLFVAQGASNSGFVQALGQDAEQVIGISAYEPGVGTRGNAQFVRAYRARWSSDPGLAAAQAYAAGKLIEGAARHAGSFDQERLRDALAGLEIETPLGRYRVDPATGRQVAATPLLTQILKGRREIVWPADRATARWQLPYPSWDARKTLGPVPE
jgi:branched-chain amino acid transport system substrate-binding protein